LKRAHVFLLGLVLTLLATPKANAADWTIRVEEPTGIYPRTNEVVAVPYAKIGGRQTAWRVTDALGNELPWQATDDALLFPATLIPGELPEYRVSLAPETKTNFVNQIQLRKIGMNRLELGNRFFRVLIDTSRAAIIEAYNLSADTYRTLNLVETSPEDTASFKDDARAFQAMGFTPISGVPEENTGWTSLGGTGPLTHVQILENGPLRGKVRLERTNENWDLTWTAGGRALLWRAQKGFRFTAISAAPYLPFDRCVGGSECAWPNGPDEAEPPDHDIAGRPWKMLPGGHVVYYHHAENYGALGFVALDTNLTWTGVGSRRFVAEKEAGDTVVGITFPQAQGWSTALQGWRENRVLRQPLLIEVEQAAASGPPRVKFAERVAEVEHETVHEPPEPFSPETVSLDGLWDLAWCEKGEGPPTNGWRKVTVPGTVHTQWLDPSKIYSPEATWLSNKEWWFKRSVNVPERFAGRRIRLQFEATDYYADAWLNGTRLGRHEGYNDPYDYDVTSTARLGGTNELLVRTWTPVDYYWKHRPYTIKGAYGAVDQKPDDITALGITRPVRLVASDPVIIKDLAVDTRLTDEGNAEVEVEIELDGEIQPSMQVELTLSPRNFSSAERYRARAQVTGGTVRVLIPVKDPQLWWTWDHGKPNLYTLDVKLRDEAGRAIDGRSLAVGLREIERVGWTFYLNRRRMFIRGSNYYDNLYLSEMDRAAYERDLGLMLRMNINLLRLHCHFSNPEFYDLADEKGVLIWQDFLEAWYPEDRAFSLRAAALYDPLIRSVRNHACVASWTTCDEESPENYRDLTKHLAARPALLDPQRRVIVRSTGRFGDAHVYHGWYDGSIWEYGRMTEPFVSELGATALPNYETLMKFMPNAWPIHEHEEEWFFRRLQIPEAMKAWGEPGNLSLKEYIPRTQAYVSRLFQIALERSRRLKYNPAGGICHFHAIDIWPSVTMAAIDFYRVPTKAFDTVQRSFAPVCASLEYDRDHWRSGETFRCGIWAINDNWEPVPDAVIRWRIVDAQGAEQAAGQETAAMAEDSVRQLGNVEWTATGRGPHQLRAEVRNQAGAVISENIFEFDVTD
jgi:beta-mannosidase